MLVKKGVKVILKKCDSCGAEIKDTFKMLQWRESAGVILVWDYCSPCIGKLIETIGKPSRELSPTINKVEHKR